MCQVHSQISRNSSSTAGAAVGFLDVVPRVVLAPAPVRDVYSGAVVAPGLSGVPGARVVGCKPEVVDFAPATTVYKVHQDHLLGPTTGGYAVDPQRRRVNNADVHRPRSLSILL